MVAVANAVYRDRYTAGKLALAGIGPWTPLSDWLDAVFVIILETPLEDVKKLEEQLAVMDAQVDPAEARKSWGATPEQQGLGGRLMEG